MTVSHVHAADALMVVLGKQSACRAGSQNRRRKSYAHLDPVVSDSNQAMISEALAAIMQLWAQQSI
jgi:hypothetical protein